MVLDANLILGLGFAFLLVSLVLMSLFHKEPAGSKKHSPTLFIDCDDTLYRCYCIHLRTYLTAFGFFMGLCGVCLFVYLCKLW